MTYRETRIGQIVAHLENSIVDAANTGKPTAKVGALLSIAERWLDLSESVSDLQPFRELGISVLSLVVEQGPENIGNSPWLSENWSSEVGVDPNAVLEVISSGIPLMWVPSSEITSDLLKGLRGGARLHIGA